MYKRLVRDALDPLHNIRKKCDVMEARLLRDKANGFPSRAGEQLGRPSGKSDPTANIALGKKDEIEAAEQRLKDHLKQAAFHASMAENECLAICGLDQIEGQRINQAQNSKVGICLNCEAVVTGVGEDRIRALRCPACYRFWNRHGTERPSEVKRGAKKMFGSIAANQITGVFER